MDIAGNRDRLKRIRQQGMSYVREGLTWEAKAESTSRVLSWAVGRGPRPDLPPPKLLHLNKAEGVQDQPNLFHSNANGEGDFASKTMKRR